MGRQPAVQSPATQLKKEDLAKLYRQFSRQKYNKYKHQFPRMRESELVSKIIKEWQSMDAQEKVNLYNTYSSEKHISDDKSQSSQKKESPGSSKQKKKKSQSKGKGGSSIPYVESSSRSKDVKGSSGTPSKKSGNVRVFIQSSSSKKQKAQSQSSDFARDGVKKDFEISETPQSKQLGTKVGAKKKKITKQGKQPRTQYLKFFKFYYDKLTSQHPRWSANQISTIIKLLWKKKISQDKTATKASLRTPRQRKSISGRMAFRRTFGYTGIQGAQRWKQLPVESKKYWRSKGFGSKSGQRKVIRHLISGPKVGRKASQSSINSQFANTLKYLRNTIA